MEKQCRDCEFWREVKINSEKDMGRCLRNPPVLMDPLVKSCPIDHEIDKNALGAVCSVWPVTDESDFCGEFVQKPSDEPPQVTVIR